MEKAVRQDDLTRVFEIRGCVLKDSRPGSYFENFDRPFRTEAIRRKIWQQVEAELAGLDAVAWMHLKAQVVPLFQTRHEKRDWQAAFDKLNEAKAYNYLARIGCTDLVFIPVSSKSKKKTPDLKGKLGTRDILCEVKTINPSDVEAAARSAVANGQIPGRYRQNILPDAFFKKLSTTVNAANRQMTSYNSDGAILRFVYVILNFDDLLNEYVDEYLQQIDSFVTTTDDLPSVELVFDAKPPFYAATSESLPSVLLAYHCEPEKGAMRCGEQDEGAGSAMTPTASARATDAP